MTVAAAMGEEATTFSKKTLLKKTGQRFQSEYSMMMGYSYAAMVLATHFIEGPVPTKLKEYKQDKLGKHAKQTVE